MSNKYKKISQLNTLAVSDLDISTGQNQAHINVLDTSCGLTDILECNHFIVADPVIPADYLVATLSKGINTFNAEMPSISLPIGSGQVKNLYRLINNSVPDYLPLSSSIVNFEITSYSTPLNLVELSSVIFSEAGDVLKSDNIFTGFSANNPGITSLEINFPAATIIQLINANSIKYLNFAKFTALQTFTLSNITNFTGGLRIHTLTSSPSINISNCAMSYYEFIGNGSTKLSRSNFSITFGENNTYKPKHIKFIDCKIISDLVTYLAKSGIEIEY